jgi:uncharacterized protein
MEAGVADRIAQRWRLVAALRVQWRPVEQSRRLESYNLADYDPFPQCTNRSGRPPHLQRSARAARTSVPLSRQSPSAGIIDLKLHQESSGALNTITSYGDGYVAINLQRHEGSIIVMPEAAVIDWPVASFEALAPEHFEALVAAAPEVVIFGSGSRLRFPHPRLTAALAKHRIGIETMDFGAACRTYNILMSEGRRVAAALLIEA